MPDIPLGKADYHRSVAKEARVQTRNRYFEQNPVLVAGLTALIARPGLRRYLEVGAGPIRATYTQPGSFNNAAFVISGEEWYRVDTNGTVTLLTSGINPGGGSVSMAATGTIGDGASAVPEYLWMADGRNLWLYMASGYAHGTISGSPANNDVVEIGGVYYKFTNGSVDAGAPAGTAGNPWLVKKSISDTLSWRAFALAIGANGEPGVDYSTALTINPSAQAVNVSATLVAVRANAVGIAGNGVTTTETGAGIAWTGATLTGGGSDYVTTVATPQDIGPISVAYNASYVVVVPAQGEGINGRFWWIDPGETTIDPLNFATAEQAPDPVFGAISFVDQIWFPGASTTEVWNFTGNIDAPIIRLRGVAFNRGTWEGTALQVKESMIIVDSDGGVFQIAGGLKRISNPAIEQRIREAIQNQASRILY